jgi:hypothetical protein
MPASHQLDPSTWIPGTSPWERILPHYTWLTRSPDSEEIFGGIRDFVVVAAAASSRLGDRHVYPSTINMTIFRTADPVDYVDDYLHPRVIVSPWGRGQIRVRYYLGQKEAPEWRWASPLPDEPGKIRLRVHEYLSGKPEPTSQWVCDPREGIEIIRDCFGD